MNKRGCIISNKYENVNSVDTFKYHSGSYELEITIKFEDGIINFDERKTHICNLENILSKYYANNDKVRYEQLGKLKDKKNGFDGKEMYYSNFLASMGEATFIFVDEYFEEINERIVSNMLFLPKDTDILSDKQIKQIKDIASKMNDGIFALALCNGIPNETEFISKKEDALEYVNKLSKDGLSFS